MKIENNNEKLTIKDYILVFNIILGFTLIVWGLVFGSIYCMDRSLALKDFQKGKRAENCIFESNCKYYNEKLY